ncbi:MAG: LysM peptidoglycan-binding domain-containing protein [Bdellovibrionales bacterium]|jgi:hypothetical protein|nr:LysM peptidoglycan-binding domain-containing protein [Bdellovibrionales bacterium]
MKKQAKLLVVFAAVATVSTVLGVVSSKSLAQDFDDVLESELDALSSGIPLPPAGAPIPTATPANGNAGSSFADDPFAGGMDDFGSELPVEDNGLASDPFASPEDLLGPEGGPEDQGVVSGDPADILPLEESKEPPPKVEARPEPVVPAPRPVVRPAPTPAPRPVAPIARRSMAPGTDEPNSSFEARLAQIYLQSQNSDPVSDERWNELLGTRAVETYSVQAGDTLWDLSQTLFADGFYWSKLWAENPGIQNPHKISKGQALRFIGGNEASPPEILVVKDDTTDPSVMSDGVFSVENRVEQTQVAFEREDVVQPVVEASREELVELEDSTAYIQRQERMHVAGAPYYREDLEGRITQADIEAGVVVEQSEILPRPILPPPSVRRSKALGDIPRSFPQRTVKLADKTVTISSLDVAATKAAAAVVPGFMAFSNTPEPMGTVEELDAGEVAASLGQTVVVRGNEPLSVGSKFYSVVPRYKVSSRENGKIGEAFEIGGVLEIVGGLDSEKRYYRAQVVYIVNPVVKGSLVLMGEPPRIPVSTKGRRVTSEMTVVGGGFSETRRLFGDGSIVFLDTRDAGVQVGDILSVQARRGERRKTEIPDQQTPVGILKVFAVSGKVASAVVVLATDDIRVGDRTGVVFPVRLPDLVEDAPRVTKAP